MCDVAKHDKKQTGGAGGYGSYYGAIYQTNQVCCLGGSGFSGSKLDFGAV
jgi:hypothetical protein